MISILNSWLGQDISELNLRLIKPPMIASFEQVVLDLRGQALGVPFWQLLGGRLRAQIPATQCTGYKTPEHTADDAQWGWEQGFRSYKTINLPIADHIGSTNLITAFQSRAL